MDVKSYAGREKGHDESKLPLPLGVEASGVVMAAGADARGSAGPVTVGDEVMAYRILGAYRGRHGLVESAVVWPRRRPRPTGLDQFIDALRHAFAAPT